jgi:MFS family permease
MALCVTEITSWGTLYYALPAMLTPLSRSTGWPDPVIMGAFSGGLLVSAAAGIPVGRLLDRFGPRPVMTAGSLAGTGALLAVAAAPSLAWFVAAWMLAGLAQSALLYPPAFAALTRWYGPQRVRALTALSLVAGLASTVFAPLAAVLADRLGWRAADVVLAAVLGVVTLPLHAVMLTPEWPAVRQPGRIPPQEVSTVVRSRAFSVLVAAMALGTFGLYAATVDLPALLTSQGTGNAIAALALGLVGVGQVCGRLGYGQLSRRTSAPARACAVLAAGAAAVIALAATCPVPAAALAAAVLAGAVRGNVTLVQATAVSDRWGTETFGTVNGIFLAPVTVATALAPGGGVMLMHWLGTPRTAFFLLAGLTGLGSTLAPATHPGREQMRERAADVRPD